MNEAILKNFNEMVKEEDFVVHNGDFCFKNSSGGKLGEGVPTRAFDYIQKLNGIWTFVAGNHDKKNSLKTHIRNLTIQYGNDTFFIVHNPIHANPNVPINLCGHVHEKYKIRKLNENSIIYNVGVDVQNFRPVSFETILRDINKWRKNERENNNSN
jgi:calcineurin-like phosphoesterase family protein